MTDAFDEEMMARALVFARRGRPSPNPHVGAVIVRGSEVLATGYHHQVGHAHAEVEALNKLGHRAEGATLYVTLEPCDHHGRTSPCSEAVLRAGITRVVIGCEDRVPGHGGGAARLAGAGVEVRMGVRRGEAEALVADFHKRALQGLPFVTLKAALTLDGRMATRTGDSRWITSHEARKHGHRMRDRADAILVGIGTVLADDPELTVRHVPGRDPQSVVLDSQLRTPLSAKLLQGARRPWIFHAPGADGMRMRQLHDLDAVLVEVPSEGGALHLESVLRELARRNVVRLLVEGGPRVHGALLDAALVDRVALFVAPRLLADAQALPFADGQARDRMATAYGLTDETWRKFGRDYLIEGAIVRPQGA